MPSQESRILVIAPVWIGDVVLSQILYRLLQRQQPEVAIDVISRPWASALLNRMPEVARHIPLEVDHGQIGLGRRRALARNLRGQYHQAIVIPQATKAALVPWLAGIQHRTGFGGGSRAGLINDIRPRLSNVVTRMAHLAREAPPEEDIPWPRLTVDPEKTRAAFHRWQMDPDMPRIGLMPGAGSKQLKRWGTAPMARLATLLVEHGHSLCVLGAERDRADGETIARVAPERVRNLCGKTSLDDAVELTAGLAAAVCNDSGLMHVAAAVNTPVVGIYGPTSPATHPPLSTRRAVRWAGVACSPCNLRTCPYGHHACMTNITPEATLESLLAIMDR